MYKRQSKDSSGNEYILKASEGVIDQNNTNIYISDSGMGIPKSSFKKIFNPGFTSKKRGWGLGLSLAKRIIEDYHSGEIRVYKSDKGNGTTMLIKLNSTI